MSIWRPADVHLVSRSCLSIRYCWCLSSSLATTTCVVIEAHSRGASLPFETFAGTCRLVEVLSRVTTCFLCLIRASTAAVVGVVFLRRSAVRLLYLTLARTPLVVHHIFFHEVLTVAGVARVSQGSVVRHFQNRNFFCLGHCRQACHAIVVAAAGAPLHPHLTRFKEVVFFTGILRYVLQNYARLTRNLLH